MLCDGVGVVLTINYYTVDYVNTTGDWSAWYKVPLVIAVVGYGGELLFAQDTAPRQWFEPRKN